MWLIWS